MKHFLTMSYYTKAEYVANEWRKWASHSLSNSCNLWFEAGFDWILQQGGYFVQQKM